MRKKRFWAGALAALTATSALAVVLAGSSSAHPARPSATFTAALVSDIGRFNDKSFNQFQLQGLNRAGAKLHVKTIAIQSNSTSDYIPNLTSAVRQGANIVIAAGFLLADSLGTIAQQNPNVHFAITDDFVSSAAGDFQGKDVHNIEGITYAVNQNAFLVGCAAAMVTKAEHKKQVIGAVLGIKIPPVDIWFAGYQAGAHYCVHNTTVLHGYSNSFTAPDLCKNQAANEIQAGANVIFNIAGLCGLGALDAAKSAGIWGIGVDQDQSFLGTYILTSGVKRVDLGVFDTIKKAKNGTYRGGSNLVFNLKNNGVAVGKWSPLLKPALKKKVVAKLAVLRKLIISGKIKPPTTF